MIIKHYAFADGTDNLVFTINSGTQGNSAASNINKISPYDYASFELNSYNIDNPRPLYNSEPLGFSSDEISSDLGIFTVPVSFSVDIGEAVSFSGITINSNVNITNVAFVLYKADGTSETLSFNENKKENFFQTNSVDVNKVDITIYEINKEQTFIDIFGVYFGKVYVYDESKIKNPKMINQVSVSGRELPIDTFSFDLFEKPEDVLFDKNQKIEIINDKVDYVFYVDNVEDNGIVYKVSCLDCVSLLEDTFYGRYDKLSVKSWVDIILEDTNISCEFDNDNISNVVLSGYIPATTKRNALIYVANATGFKIIKQPNLKFVKLKDYDVNFDDNSIFLNSYSKTKETPSKIVELKQFDYETIEYFDEETGDDELQIYGNYHDVGTHIAILDEVVNDYLELKVISSDEPDGSVNLDAIEVIEKSSNYVKFNMNKYAYVKIFTRYITKLKNESFLIKKIDNEQLYKNYTTQTIDSFSLIKVIDGKKDYKNRAKELLKYYSVNEKAKAKVLWKYPKLDVYVNIYGEKYAISKLTTNFTEAVEIEVEKIVD